MLQEGVNGSTDWLLSNIKSHKTDAELKAKGGDAVDVRDVAAIQAELLTKEGAANQRYILSAGKASPPWTHDYIRLRSDRTDHG